MSDIAEALARLRVRFVARACEDLVDLKRWSADPSAEPDRLWKLVHRLAGAGGTFGFHSLSDRAKAAEDALATGDAARSGALAALIGELEQLTHRV